jgi:hypothetical protein
MELFDETKKMNILKDKNFSTEFSTSLCMQNWLPTLASEAPKGEGAVGPR